MVEPLVSSGVDKRVIDVYEHDFPYTYGSYVIRTSRLVHDVQNCAYHIFFFGEFEDFVFYATDTGTLDGIEAKKYDWYFIESNHTQADIEARAAEKLARGEYAYETRAAANHLSYEQAMDFLARNAGPHSKYVLLHGHEE